MQLFTTDQLMQVIITAKDTESRMFGIFLGAIGENIATSIMQLWNSLLSVNWPTVVTTIFLLFSMVFIGYRLVRDNLLDSIEYLFKN
jgi:hypothetical protein